MWNVVCALAILALGAVPGLASPIFVANFSFEELPGGGLPFSCGAGCAWSQDAIPGWTTTGSALTGQFHPDSGINSTHFNTLSDGPNSGYSNGGVISQTVVPSVELGWVYTLFVDLGWRNDMAFAASAALSVDGVTVATADGITQVQGTFSTYKATYIGSASDVGKSLTIDLLSSAPQGNFDNVRLDAVPEPVPFMLIGTGLLMLPMLRRSRTNSKTRA